MAIQKFTTANATDLSVFKTWLDAFKDSSFLKDFTVELSTTTSTNDTITFGGSNNRVILKTFVYATPSAGVPILTCYTGEDTSAGYVFTDSAYQHAVYITGAMLCNNGLIIKLYLHSYYNNSNHYATEYVMVVKDSEGNLAIVVPRVDATGQSATVSTNNIGFRAIGYNQSKTATVAVTATFNESKTSICPILIDNNYGITLPNVYQSVQSQLNGIIFDSASIENADFITNGYWFIKD